MNAKQLIQRAVNKAIADGASIVTEIPAGYGVPAYPPSPDTPSVEQAARAMLAALEGIRSLAEDQSGVCPIIESTAAKAIAAAKAAGIKVEG